jgi:glycosyltransferase involved in cell wall biosynthesis
MKLTIAIPTIFERENKFNYLYNKLHGQAELYKNEVEIIFLRDNKEISIGQKRQKLLEKANGDFVVMIDDDDDISENYIQSIIDAICPEIDCIGFEIECYGTTGKTASVSNKWDDWADNKEGYDYVRTPYNKSPIIPGLGVSASGV